jgi:Cu2+-exporting ATPase
MTCCTPGGELGFAQANGDSELLLASRVVGEGVRQSDLSVSTIHCGGCIQTIESTLGRLPDVAAVRVNLSTRRVTIRWRGETPPPLIATLESIGYPAHVTDIGAPGSDAVLKELMRALAVAGFAAGNIMMLSMGIWAGADAETRDLFYWLSAAIALPAMAYSGRVFFRSAWSALRHGRTNMDVPISIGVLLAFGMSVYETVTQGAHAYFDAATSLLFFLLIGRTLDHMMRERARHAVSGLAKLAARGAMVLDPDGLHRYLPVGEILPGMSLLLPAGERVPVDARVIGGRSELDCALVSGESIPRSVAEGDALQAGTLNLTAPLTIEATAAAKDSFLAEMTRMMETVEAGRSRYRRIADRAARLYAPVVHLTALMTFAGWMIAGSDAHQAVTVAIAVLIVTCPCALGLAVPMVQVVAARRLFERGIMVRDGSALERLAEVDHAVFDKTGTLTEGTPNLQESPGDARALAVAAAMAAQSRHPYSRAIAAAGRARNVAPLAVGDLREVPGGGLEATIEGCVYRLGRPDWALNGAVAEGEGDSPNVVLSENGRCQRGFHFQDALRPDAAHAIAALRSSAISAEILSGDHEASVRRLATDLGLPYSAGVSPLEKTAHVAALATAARKVLMVGDGLNDAPALVAAHVSMAPGSAADVGRNAADFVFLRESLDAVPAALAIARDAGRLVRQNLILSIAYNAIAVPVAILGQVTPLLAAIAMSLSSILVVANALRLRRPRGRGRASSAVRSEFPVARPALGSGA